MIKHTIAGLKKDICEKFIIEDDDITFHNGDFIITFSLKYLAEAAGKFFERDIWHHKQSKYQKEHWELKIPVERMRLKNYSICDRSLNEI